MNGIDSFLWFLSIVLAIVLLIVGLVLVRDSPGGKKRLGWAETAPANLTRMAGTVMIVGALCLVVPALIPGLAWLTPLAAAVLVALMLAIVQTYIARRDSEGASTYILLILMLVALTVGRWPALGLF